MTTIGQNLKLRNGVVYGVVTVAGRQRWKRCPYQGTAALKANRPLACVVKWLDKWMAGERDARTERTERTDAARVPTWQQLQSAYWQVSAAEHSEQGKPSRETVDENIVKLGTLLKQMNIAKDDYLTAGTPERVAAWIAMRAKDEAGRYSAMRTLAQASSVWARWTRPRYAALGLALPECLDKWPRVRALAPKYVDPPDELKRKTAEMGERLFIEEPGTWLAFFLMFHCGMRPGDAVRARMDWFRWDGNEILLGFTPHKTSRSAGGRTVEQRIGKTLFACVENARARMLGGAWDFVMPEREEDRLKRINRINDAMRGIGWRTEKAAYELRKLFVSAVYNSHGLQWAAAYSGDNPTTIERYYAAAYRRDAPVVDVAKVVMG